MLKILGLKEKVHLSSSYEELTSNHMILFIVTYKLIRRLVNLFHYYCFMYNNVIVICHYNK